MTPDILFNVIIKNRNAVVNSRDVAKVFHKNHFHLLRDIDRLRTDWGKMIPITESKNGFSSKVTGLKSEPSRFRNIKPG